MKIKLKLKLGRGSVGVGAVAGMTFLLGEISSEIAQVHSIDPKRKSDSNIF